MTALQVLDAAEIEFRDHCRERYEAPALVYQSDSALIERMALKVRAFAESMAADLKQLHAVDGPDVSSADRIARLVAEALEDDLESPAASLLYAQLRYRGEVPQAASRKVAA